MSRLETEPYDAILADEDLMQTVRRTGRQLFGESDPVGGTAAAGGGGIGGGGVPFGQLMTTSISSPGPNDANSFPAHLIPSSSFICIAFGVT